MSLLHPCLRSSSPKVTCTLQLPDHPGQMQSFPPVQSQSMSHTASSTVFICNSCKSLSFIRHEDCAAFIFAPTKPIRGPGTQDALKMLIFRYKTLTLTGALNSRFVGVKQRVRPFSWDVWSNRLGQYEGQCGRECQGNSEVDFLPKSSVPVARSFPKPPDRQHS